jgi:glycosyltransferase involved in cell wall biosynthesis
MRICIIYDCLFPWTIGGAERWYRRLAERCASAGHEVTYLTLRQWDKDSPPHLPGVRVVAVGPRISLYRDGKRRIVPPILFGVGVFVHLILHGRRYDRLCMASFPFFSLLAAGVLRPLFRYTMLVDWIEVWRKDYWRAYLGPIGGRLGWCVQGLCAKFRHLAYSFSALHAERARLLLGITNVTVLPGFDPGGHEGPVKSARTPPTILYAGRMIPEKRVPLLVEALALCMERNPTLNATLYGRGPDADRTAARIAELGLGDRIRMPGFVEQAEIDEAMATATVLVQPSEREGYGIVVVEATARGVPVVVVASVDNAATELVEEGLNGYIAADTGPNALASAIMRCVAGGQELRSSTYRWYQDNAWRVSIEHSADLVLRDIESS